MNTDTQSLRDDLAYLRQLADPGEGSQLALARGYLAGGLIYGGQVLLHVAQAAGLLPSSGPVSLSIGLGPTVVFAAVMIWISIHHRMMPQGGPVSKAIGVAFASIGLSNLAFIAVIGAVALRERSLIIWLIYPCTVFVLQGIAWLVAYMLRRRQWHALVAFGWFASAIVMAIFIENLAIYALVGGLALFGCMALPGWLMLRHRDG
jgi:hypothetical protein